MLGKIDNLTITPAVCSKHSDENKGGGKWGGGGGGVTAAVALSIGIDTSRQRFIMTSLSEF